jgi:uncharacterized protein YrrD
MRMATQPDVVKQSDLLNQLVLSRDTLEELGRVEALWLYPKQHRVLGFICHRNLFGAQKKVFKLSQIEALGENGILTHGQPEDTDSERVQQLESVMGFELWSNSGSRIGKIVNYCFHLRTGIITQYLWVPKSWNRMIGDIYQLTPSDILSIGNKRVLVSETAARSRQIYSEGIQQKLTKVKIWLKEDYTQVTQELKSLAKQAKEQAQSIAAQTKEAVQTLGEQIGEQIKEETHPFVNPTVENPPISQPPPNPESQTAEPQKTQPSTAASRLVEDDELEDDEPWI